MNLWLLVIAVSVLQEFSSTSAVLLAAHRAGLHVWVITTVWAVATVFEVCAGFFLGKFVMRRFPDAGVSRWGKKAADAIRRRMGRGGTGFLLSSLGFLAFAPIVGFVAAWFDVSLVAVVMFAVLGEAVWYALEWATALGAFAGSGDFATELVAVVSIGILAALLLAWFWRGDRKMFHRTETKIAE